MHPSLASGVTGAAPIWNRIIREALKGKPDEPFVRPSSIIEIDVDAFGGGLPVEGGATRKELFIQGTEPTGPASQYQSIKVSKKDGGKLANSVDIAKLEYDTKSYVVFKEQDPVSTDGKNRWQEAIDAWVAAQGDPKYHPPTQVAQTSDQIGLTIKEPGDKQQINDNDVKVRVEAGSTSGISKIEVFVDGTLVKESSGSNFSDTINMSNGIHTIKAKATDSQGKTAEQERHVGINTPYVEPSPTPTPTP